MTGLEELNLLNVTLPIACEVESTQHAWLTAQWRARMADKYHVPAMLDRMQSRGGLSARVWYLMRM